MVVQNIITNVFSAVCGEPINIFCIKKNCWYFLINLALLSSHCFFYLMHGITFFYLFFLGPILLIFGRIGGSYDERRFVDERYSRDNLYSRNSFHHDILDRENYPPPPPPVGIWPHSRRRSFEEEFPIDRESRRYEKQYVDPYHEVDTYHDPEPDSFQDFDKFRDGYQNADNFRDRGFEKSARLGGRDRDDYAHDNYDGRSRVSHQSREDSRERDYDYGRSSYDSDYDRGNKRDGNWRSRSSRDRERDLSPYRRHDRERDQSPYRRHERSRSRARDDHSRSRSPRGRSYGRSHREDSFDDARHERSEKRRDREEKRHREYYSVVDFISYELSDISYIMLNPLSH